METQAIKSPTSQEKIDAFLKVLDVTLREMQHEVNTSMVLNEQGISNDFITQIKKVIDADPLQNLFEVSNNLDSSIKEILNGIATQFFKSKRNDIASVYRSLTTNNDLHYSIILATDSTEKRLELFDFLNSYEMLELAEKFPLYFQFVPARFENKIINSEKVLLA
jgi:hypothetical protein